MAVSNAADFPIDPSTTDGIDLADRLNRLAEAIRSTEANPSKPGYIKAGGLWVKTISGGLELYLHDGTDDVLLLQRKNGASVVPVAGMQLATTVLAGITKLSEATNSTSNTLAATPSAVKALRDELTATINKNLGGYVGQIFEFSTPVLPTGFPGFICNGSTVTNGRIDYPKLATSGSLWITVSGDDLVIHDSPDVTRGKGTSGRAVGEFEDDATRKIEASWGGNYATISPSFPNVTGAFKKETTRVHNIGGTAYNTGGNDLGFDSSLVVPTASENRMKSKTTLRAIYHGEII